MDLSCHAHGKRCTVVTKRGGTAGRPGFPGIGVNKGPCPIDSRLVACHIRHNHWPASCTHTCVDVAKALTARTQRARPSHRPSHRQPPISTSCPALTWAPAWIMFVAGLTPGGQQQASTSGRVFPQAARCPVVWAVAPACWPLPRAGPLPRWRANTPWQGCNLGCPPAFPPATQGKGHHDQRA